MVRIGRLSDDQYLRLGAEPLFRRRPSTIFEFWRYYFRGLVAHKLQQVPQEYRVSNPHEG